jgi:TPR repeat protein
MAVGVTHVCAQEAHAEEKKSSPWEVFKFGFSAYKSGHKDQALQAYRDASEQGQIGATWKLGRMYAEGDGVPQDDYEAYKYFSEIVQQDVEPGSRDERYVANALAELGRYSLEGIPGTPVEANPAAAQEYFQRAANYGSPIGQFEMGKMYFEQKRSRSSIRQAGLWLKLAAEKGHEGARAMLGNLLFQSGKVVDGLAMMTTALERAEPTDRPWIRSMQEEAFAVTDEVSRRNAIKMSEDMLAGSQ